MGATDGIGSRYFIPIFVICLAAVAMAGEGDPSDGDGEQDAEDQVMK